MTSLLGRRPRPAGRAADGDSEAPLPAERFAFLTVLAVGIAFALVLMPTPQHDYRFLAAAGVVGWAMIVVALCSGMFPHTARLAVPLGYVAMIGLLREAEGGSASGFGGFFLVPVIFLALLGGRSEVVVGLVAIVVAQVLPLLVWGSPDYPRGGWRGTLVLTSGAALAAFTIQQLLTTTRLRASENARLYAEANRWSRRLESLIEVGNALTTETQLERLLHLLAVRLRELLDARFVAVLLPAPDGGLRCAAAAGEDAGELTGRMLTRAERDDAHTAQGLWVPLIAHDREIGVIAAYENLGALDGSFTDEDRRLAETFAARAAVAVDLSERVARDVVLRVVAAQEGERRRLARELHDETGQTLTSILIGLKALEETVPRDSRGLVSDLRASVVGALRGVRRIVVELRPKALDDLGLVPALERLTSSVAEQAGLSVAFDATTPQRLPGEIESALYRIVQEGLTNVVRHAQAQNVSVLLGSSNGSVLLVLEDDGSGFDPGQTDGRGFGLEGMNERVQLLGGTLELSSRESGGTSLVVEVPLK